MNEWTLDKAFAFTAVAPLKVQSFLLLLFFFFLLLLLAKCTALAALESSILQQHSQKPVSALDKLARLTVIWIIRPFQNQGTAMLSTLPFLTAASSCDNVALFGCPLCLPFVCLISDDIFTWWWFYGNGQSLSCHKSCMLMYAHVNLWVFVCVFCLLWFCVFCSPGNPWPSTASSYAHQAWLHRPFWCLDCMYFVS